MREGFQTVTLKVVKVVKVNHGVECHVMDIDEEKIENLFVATLRLDNFRKLCGFCMY